MSRSPSPRTRRSAWRPARGAPDDQGPRGHEPVPEPRRVHVRGARHLRARRRRRPALEGGHRPLPARARPRGGRRLPDGGDPGGGLTDPIVIVGASLAGLRAAQAIRRAGHDGDVVVVGEEEHLPYTRPPLSKELLAGDQEVEQTALPGRDLDVTWRLGERATGLDPARHELTLASGEALRYGKLLIASGARPRHWPGEDPLELEGVHMLRNLEDALALRAAFEAGSPRLAVVGAGFIGCEVAATARKRGLEVTVVDVAPHPMPALGPEVGERCAALHREHGVDLRLGVGVDGFVGNGRIEAIRLADGSQVECDLAVVALGAIPNTDWLIESGLELQPGVVCDATLAARDAQDVFAAGDAAAWPHPMADGGTIRIDHWTN